MRFHKWVAVALACIVLIACSTQAFAQEPDEPHGVNAFIVSVNAEARTIELIDLDLVDYDEVYDPDNVNSATYTVAADAVFKLGRWMDIDLGIRTDAEFKDFLDNYDGPADQQFTFTEVDGVISVTTNAFVLEDADFEAFVEHYEWFGSYAFEIFLEDGVIIAAEEINTMP